MMLMNEDSPAGIIEVVDDFRDRHVVYVKVDAGNIHILREMNLTLFPLNYPESFYRDILYSEKVYANLVYWRGICIGSFSCRLEPTWRLNSTTAPPPKLTTITPFSSFFGQKELTEDEKKANCEPLMAYIMTLGVLAPYRQMGFGSLILDHILNYYHTSDQNAPVAFAALHVHTANMIAVNFYEQRGFRNIGIVDNYYKRIVPTTAFILKHPFSSFDS